MVAGRGLGWAAQGAPRVFILGLSLVPKASADALCMLPEHCTSTHGVSLVRPVSEFKRR